MEFRLRRYPGARPIRQLTAREDVKAGYPTTRNLVFARFIAVSLTKNSHSLPRLRVVTNLAKNSDEKN